jgi:hypothetical protein
MYTDHEYNTAVAREAVMVIDPSTVVRVYSGAHGCACGCRGNYSDAARQIKATVTKMKRLVSEGCAAWHCSNANGEIEFLVVETDTRTHTAYFAN